MYLPKYDKLGPILLLGNWQKDLGPKGFAGAILMEDGKIKTMGRCKIIKLRVSENLSNNDPNFGKSAHLPKLERLNEKTTSKKN